MWQNLSQTGLKFVKNLYHAKKQAKQAKKPDEDAFFFTLTLRLSTFHNSFRLLQRAFHKGSVMFLKINLVPN